MKQLVDLIESCRYMYIDILYVKTCATTKISTVAGYMYHVVLATLLFMYVELQLTRKQSRTVELRNVTDSTLFIHSKNICDQCPFGMPFPKVCV